MAQLTNGLTTLAACGPLDDADTLTEATLRVCDVGHVAIAWRDWDGARCPICARLGTLSGIIAEEFARERDAIDEAAHDEVTNAEESESQMRKAVREAARLLERAGMASDDARNGLITAAYELLERAS